ncbi:MULTISPECIES: single-stranded DNA-binding protein [Snodgrassella]|uniref:single-stranded DNA-binding protein n=1 Tax=Snodgrassella TaxID=1193515 RepID=UPI0008155539|nr:MULTISPECIES: single-stranded DNA-binding protein [Snodgrassella]MCO6514697.1 single-stranded DNA-binding protein [Snodgrassella sp.]MCO6520505.1 single-stranded DNA-binding protein [Snodgrassella sp.]SCC08457.1 single-strand DNA-binding protein [Snodgrassella sp. R-53583]
MSVNKVILVGRLGRDPETRYMPSGEAVTNFSIATEERWKDKSGQSQTRTEWHNITLFGKLGEIASQYLHKGSQVFIEGRIQSRKYSGKDGIERTAYDIIGNEMRMLGSSNNSHDSGGHNTAPAASNSPPAPPRRQAPRPAPTPAPVDDIDDDIPF